jgi:hypothetical protein
MRGSRLLLYFALALLALAWSGSNAQATEQCAPWLGCSSCQVVLGNSWVKVNGQKEFCGDRCGCKLETCAGIQHLRTMMMCQVPHCKGGQC